MNQLKNITAFSEDIKEHLETLSNLSKECDHITELGVRDCVSTWAFIDGLHKGGKLISIDIVSPPPDNLSKVIKVCNELGIKFKFILDSSLKVELQETDLLFIDTIHTNKQLTKELELHSQKVKKFIVLHDTESCHNELWPVIENFIKSNWIIKSHYKNNNGLTILSRI